MQKRQSVGPAQHKIADLNEKFTHEGTDTCYAQMSNVLSSGCRLSQALNRLLATTKIPVDQSRDEGAICPLSCVV